MYKTIDDIKKDGVKNGEWVSINGVVYLVGDVDNRPKGITLRLERPYEIPVYLDIDS